MDRDALGNVATLTNIDTSQPLWGWRYEFLRDDDEHWNYALAGANGQVWFERRDVGGAWVFAHRVVLQGSSPVVAETRIFPFEPCGPDERRPGEWWKSGQETIVPPGGLKARDLRSVRLPETTFKIVQVFATIVVDLVADHEGHVFPPELQPFLDAVRPRRRTGGRKPTDDVFLLRIADAYDRICRTERRAPVSVLRAELAAAGNVAAHKTVAGWVDKARTRGFLNQRGEDGRPGRTLTDHARQLLRDANEAESKPARGDQALGEEGS